MTGTSGIYNKRRPSAFALCAAVYRRTSSSDGVGVGGGGGVCVCVLATGVLFTRGHAVCYQFRVVHSRINLMKIFPIRIYVYVMRGDYDC